MLRHSASSSSSPIYTALARLTKLNSKRSNRVLLASRKTSRAKTTTPLILLLILVLALGVTVVFLFPAIMSSSSTSATAAAPFENPRPVVKKLLSEAQSEGQGATVRRSIGRYPPFIHSLHPLLLAKMSSESSDGVR
jgi:hypothetical protein